MIGDSRSLNIVGAYSFQITYGYLKCVCCAVIQAVVNIGAQHNFGLIIEATYGGHWTGDIAIDDVMFADCNLRTPITNCDDSTQFACADRTQCISKRYYCDGMVSCLPSAIAIKQCSQHTNIKSCSYMWLDFQSKWTCAHTRNAF